MRLPIDRDARLGYHHCVSSSFHLKYLSSSDDRMCFSAEASFAVSAVLLPAGVYCTSVAVRKRPAYLPLAIVPIAFSLQQLCEGLVWTGLARNDGALVRVGSLSFLAFALAFWPFWVPFSILFLAERRRVKQCL